MKIQEIKIGNDKIVHIYLNQGENDNDEIQQKINKIKEEHKVVLFVSGDNEPERVLREMVKIMQNDLV